MLNDESVLPRDSSRPGRAILPRLSTSSGALFVLGCGALGLREIRALILHAPVTSTEHKLADLRSCPPRLS